MGDRAVRESLNAFATADAANGPNGPLHHISHLQLVDPADFRRFAALGVVADIQFGWGERDPATEGAMEPYLGPERYRYVYPAGSLHAAGAMIAAGSDWDISSYDPFEAMEIGVTRVDGNAPRPPLNIEEAVPLDVIVDAYTINAAIALGDEETLGSIEVGKRADIVIVNQDIFSVAPADIGETMVLATWLDGRLVYEAAKEEIARGKSLADFAANFAKCVCPVHALQIRNATPVPGMP